MPQIRRARFPGDCPWCPWPVVRGQQVALDLESRRWGHIWCWRAHLAEKYEPES